MAGNNDKGKPKSVAVPVEPLDMAATIAFLLKVAPDEPMTEKNVARLVKVYGIKQKAMGGKIKKKMVRGGKVHKKTYAKGGGMRKAQHY